MAAAEKLVEDLAWDKSEIDALIFVTQTPDYILPATACIIQDRLGLPKTCFAQDISLGCSGWVYGLSTITSMMMAGDIRKGLLLCGDAKQRTPRGNEDPLFGHAGTVTALEFSEGAPELLISLGTDGSGYADIITPDGGARNGITQESFQEEIIDGRTYNRLEGRMNGMNVFSFAISRAPKEIKSMAKLQGIAPEDYDYIVFHQANKFMIDFIVKKLKVDTQKVPMCLKHFGNTSSASIPLTIVTEMNDVCFDQLKLISCGFGVGLSWGTASFTLDKYFKISKLVELE